MSAQKVHPYEAIFVLNKGLDLTIQGLERLRRTKNSSLDPACLTEKLTLFELHQCSLNSYLRGKFDSLEQAGLPRFEKLYREFEDLALDQVQVYRDLRAVEERRRKEWKPPKGLFLSDDEQHAYDVSAKTSRDTSEDSIHEGDTLRG